VWLQLPQDAGQLLGWHMKQRSVGEDAIKTLPGRSSLRKSCCHTSHPVSARAMVAKAAAPSSPMAVWLARQGLKVAPRPATKIENRERRLAFDMSQ